jgi:hypothetical protein
MILPKLGLIKFSWEKLTQFAKSIKVMGNEIVSVVLKLKKKKRLKSI